MGYQLCILWRVSLSRPSCYPLFTFLQVTSEFHELTKEKTLRPRHSIVYPTYERPPPRPAFTMGRYMAARYPYRQGGDGQPDERIDREWMDQREEAI